MKKTTCLILIIFLAIIMIGCITSVRPDVRYPADADWSFEYFDSFGESIREGKCAVKFNEKDGTFILTLIESSFGENATINGHIENLNPQNQTYHFKGNGDWFSVKDFKFEGDFNSTLTKIYDGAVAYSSSIENDVKDLLDKLRIYREAVIKYDMLSEEEKQTINPPEKPIGEDYIEGLSTWKAEFIKIKPND